MNFKNLVASISMLLILVIAPFSTVGALAHAGHSHTEGEDENNPLENLKDSWHELLDKYQLREKQDIRVFRLPEDVGPDGTGLTVLWGTWWQFTDKNGDTWNVNAPFSYTQHARIGNQDATTDELKKTRTANNVKRKNEDIFLLKAGLFQTNNQGEKLLTEVKKSALTELIKFEGFPIVKNIEESTLTYVARFKSNYLDDPASYTHYQKLIATPVKAEASKEDKGDDLPYLAGYEANKLFFNWHPKLRGVQLINTNKDEFYQFSLGWRAWGAVNAKKNKDEKFKVGSGNLPLLRAMLTINQLTKNTISAEEVDIEDTTDANRLAWLLLDHHEEEEDGDDHDHHFKPADIFADIFTSGKSDETFKDWMVTVDVIRNIAPMVDEIEKLLPQNLSMEAMKEIINDMTELLEDMTPGQKRRFNKEMGTILASLKDDVEPAEVVTSTQEGGTGEGSEVNGVSPENEDEGNANTFPEPEPNHYITMIEAALAGYEIYGWDIPPEKVKKTTTNRQNQAVQPAGNTGMQDHTKNPGIQEFCGTSENDESSNNQQVGVSDDEGGTETIEKWDQSDPKIKSQCNHFLSRNSSDQENQPVSDGNSGTTEVNGEQPSATGEASADGGEDDETTPFQAPETEQVSPKATNGYSRKTGQTLTLRTASKEFTTEAREMVEEIKKIINGNNDMSTMTRITNEITEDMSEDKKTRFHKVMGHILASLGPNNNPTVIPYSNSMEYWALQNEQDDEQPEKSDEVETEEPDPMEAINQALKTWKKETKPTMKQAIETAKPFKKTINQMFNTVHVLNFSHLDEPGKPILKAIIIGTTVTLATGGAVGGGYLLYSKRKLLQLGKLKPKK